MRQTFHKSERLCNRKLIQRLFGEGSSFFIYPFRVSYLIIPETAASLQVMLVVSKRSIKGAADRNRIRRRMREAWRKAKSPFYLLNPPEGTMIVAVQYVQHIEVSYEVIDEKIKLILQRLQKQHEETTT